MTHGSVGALIINWNGADDTIELLQSLSTAASPKVRLKVSIVDNASEDSDFRKLVTFVESTSLGYPVSILRNAINVGVPAAYNQSIQAVGPDCEAYLRLDNDVVLRAGAVDLLLGELLSRRKDGVGIVGGNVKLYSDRSTNNGGAVSIDLVRGRTTTAYPSTSTLCDGVLGCIMLVDGPLVRAFLPDVFLGALFICTDESELSLRAERQGVRTCYVAELVGYHKSGMSTSRVGSLASYYSARNWAYLRLRYTRGVARRVAVLVSIIAYSLLRVAQLRPLYCGGSMSGIAMFVTHWLDARVRAENRVTRSKP